MRSHFFCRFLIKWEKSDRIYCRRTEPYGIIWKLNTQIKLGTRTRKSIPRSFCSNTGPPSSSTTDSETVQWNSATGRPIFRAPFGVPMTAVFVRTCFSGRLWREKIPSHCVLFYFSAGPNILPADQPQKRTDNSFAANWFLRKGARTAVSYIRRPFKSLWFAEQQPVRRKNSSRWIVLK